MRLAALAFALVLIAPRVTWADDIIPLDLSGHRPAVSVAIGDTAPELWVFDTGAGGSMINADRAEAHNLPNLEPTQLHSPAGGTPMQAYITRVPQMRVGPVALTNVRAAAAQTMLPDRAGVLSPYAFRGKYVTLDLARSQLRIADKTAANAPRGEGLPYHGEGHGSLPQLSVSVGGQDRMAHIDSGNPGGLTLPYALASELQFAVAPVKVGHARLVDGVHDRYRATLQGEVRIGPLTLTNPEVTMIDGLPFVNLGALVLRQLTVTLDPEQQRTWVALAN